MLKLPRLYRYVYKDAETGRFVSAVYAKANQRTTVRLRLWFWRKVPA